MTYHLQIKVNEPSLISYYKKSIEDFKNSRTDMYRDSGFDLFVNVPLNISNTSQHTQIKVDHCVSCAVYKELDNGTYIPSGYYLYPRSSISKTPLRLANSVGIIDSGYRGHLIAKFDVLPNTTYEIKQGDRLCQICSPDLSPFSRVFLVDTLSYTTRGTGCFGSTGK